MSTTTSLPSERMAIAGVISPGSLNVGANNSNWIDLALYTQLLGVIATGTLGTGATLDAKWQLADDAAGANAVDSTQNTLTQILKASGDNKQALMNFDSGRSKPFSKRFARLVLTVGGAASAASATILGVPRHQPATDFDLASVVQIV